MKINNKYGWWLVIGSFLMEVLGAVLFYKGVVYGLFPMVIGGFILGMFFIDQR